MEFQSRTPEGRNDLLYNCVLVNTGLISLKRANYRSCPQRILVLMRLRKRAGINIVHFIKHAYFVF